MKRFNWHDEFKTGIELPVKQVWDCLSDPNNWLKWEKRIDKYEMDGPLKEGSLIRGKVKGREAYISLLITDCQRYESLGTFIKIPFFKRGLSSHAMRSLQAKQS